MLKRYFSNRAKAEADGSVSLFDDRFMFIASLIGVIVVTILLIYLTPLKHLTLIAPISNDIDPKEFYADYSQHRDQYMLIDVRSTTVYNSAHAVGAINIPIENLIDEHFTLPKHGKKIALICTSGRLAGIAYGYLENWGFLNLIRIKGGLENWSLEGLPIEGNNIPHGFSGVDEHQ